MENKKTIESVLNETLTNLKTMIDVDSIIGKPIIQKDKTIIPISKVSVGFVSGGGEYNKYKKNIDYPFAGGSGGGCNISPLGFLIVMDKNIKFIKITYDNNLEKIIDIINNFNNTKK